MNEFIMEELYSGNNYDNIYDLDNEEFDYSIYNNPYSQEPHRPRQESPRQESPSPSIKNLINYDSNSDEDTKSTDSKDSDSDDDSDEFSDEFSDGFSDESDENVKKETLESLDYNRFSSIKYAIYLGVLSMLYYYW